ncbi:MAG: GH92 family glycosyl hydrolase [Bacteroidales bacterium]|nr:GH92 family glycosyl hydrolase [Bacteroidales bacterium]
MRLHSLLLAALMVAACSTPKEEDYTAFVNPKIGSGGHGHVFVGANVPFGLVQLGPTSLPQQWDWCSGYHDSDSTVIGFSHTHLSGTGVGDLFDVTVMPVTEITTFERGSEKRPGSGAWSYALRSQEVCKPGYYSVPLERYGIRAEMTATARVGFHRYTFPEAEQPALVFDLENGGCWDRVTDAGFEAIRNADGLVTALAGWRYSSGWARNQKIFFWAEFSQPASGFTEEGLYCRYEIPHTSGGENVLVKVALSPVSIEGARANMAAELPGWDFDATMAAAREAWNRELGKIKVQSPDRDRKTVFYTALYHTMVAPSVFNDVNGDYRGSDDQVRHGDFQNYTTWSLWDTYRAAMPLATILHPEKVDDFTRTFYHIYKEQGDLPVWHLMGNETDCMVGNPGTVAFADFIVKGFTGSIPASELIAAMVDTDQRDDRGLDLRHKYGFIPSDLYGESVANDMEYAIADAALANAAAVLGYPEVEVKYREQSHSYRHYWDPELQFFRGRKTDGQFTEPFNPVSSGRHARDYTEGTAWQYLWLVPQDVDGLVTLFGSKEAALAKLDGLFEAPDHVEGEDAPPDITGLIGQYAHGNEPGHHTIYLYSMLGAPQKAAARLRQVYDELYFNGVEGLAGNEDVGQMSAWYVLSSMGFYQVEPASTRFWFGLPLFPRQEVQVAGGTFTITATGPHDGFIQLIRLNGKPYDKPYIDYADIVSGGTLEYVLTK